MMDDILARISEFFVGGSSSPVAPRPYVRDPQREKRSELMRRLMEALSDDFNDVSPVAITATVDFAVFNVTATTDRLSRIPDSISITMTDGSIIECTLKKQVGNVWAFGR
jgi:hypothetical protein